MKVRSVLLALAAVILIPVGLIAAYIWHAGLDLNAPADTRAWIRVCARSRVDVYCKAAARVMNEAQGPLVFLHPNMSDHDITAELTRWKPGFTASDVEAVARANLFPATSLKSGTYTALDGQQREVVCGLPDRGAPLRYPVRPAASGAP